MKLKEIEANIKIQGSDGSTLGTINAKAKYDEPENLQEFIGMNSLTTDEKLRIVQYGLNTYHQAKVRSENEIGKAAKILFEAKLFPSFKAAFEHLVGIQNANAHAREKANPEA